MGNQSCSQNKEKKQDFSLSCLNDIYKFRMEKKYENNLYTNNENIFCNKFHFTNSNNFINTKKYILLALTLLNQTDIFHSNRLVSQTIYQPTIFPEIYNDDYENKSIISIKGDEDFNQTMNNLVFRYTENKDQVRSVSSNKNISVLNNEEIVFNNSLVEVNQQIPDIRQKLRNLYFQDDFNIEDYIKKETQRIKDSNEQYNENSKNIEQRKSFDGEKEFDILKNKYLEQSLKSKRKSLISGENQQVPKQFSSTYRSNTLKKTDLVRNDSQKILYPKVKQNVKLFVKNSNNSIVVKKNLSNTYRGNYYAQRKTYDEILSERNTANEKTKNLIKSSSKSKILNGSKVINNNTNKFKNKNTLIRKKSESSNDLKKPTGGISLRIDLRQLIQEEDLFKEEIEYDKKLSTSKNLSSSISNS